MTILSACQKAAIKILGGGGAPAELFSSTDEFAVELRTLANETADNLAKAHEWRKLTILETEAGDGSATSFDLPADFDRLPIKMAVWSTASSTPLSPARDLDEWLDMSLTGFTATPGVWIMLGGELQVLPAPGASDTLKYYYLSNLLWTASGGTVASKTEADSDGDTCALPERLITLGVVWRWKQQKGKEYAEDLRSFEIAFGEETGRDRAPRIIAIGAPRSSSGAALAYPGTI